MALKLTRLYAGDIVATEETRNFRKLVSTLESDSDTITEGLAYTLNADGASYSCTGIGTVTDTAIVIASEVNGLPVTSIGNNAFKDCTTLSSVNIPNSVTSIGNFAFYECSSLTAITIPEGVTTIGDWAFFNCILPTSIVIPEGVTSIGERAFSCCRSLESISLPDSVTSISANMLSGCGKLTKITIPNSVTSIGSSAFTECTSLTAITIPSSVTSIGDAAFMSCSSLTAVLIPISVVKMGSSAFIFCNKNLTIYMERDAKPSEWSDWWNAETNETKHSVKWKYKLIRFTIDGVHYYTSYNSPSWDTWISSQWNTDGYMAEKTGLNRLVKTKDGAQVYLDGVAVNVSVSIQEGANYTVGA